jgi:hypothetical protein
MLAGGCLGDWGCEGTAAEATGNCVLFYQGSVCRAGLDGEMAGEGVDRGAGAFQGAQVGALRASRQPPRRRHAARMRAEPSRSRRPPARSSGEMTSRRNEYSTPSLRAVRRGQRSRVLLEVAVSSTIRPSHTPVTAGVGLAALLVVEHRRGCVISCFL